MPRLKHILSALPVLSLLTLYAAPAWSDNAGTHGAYCDRADSTAASVSCLKHHLDDAQNRLNKKYDRLTGALEGQTLENLRALQKTWLDYRDTQCSWESAQAGSPSLEKIRQLSCLARMTEDRTELLTAILPEEDGTPATERMFGALPHWMNALNRDNPDIFWDYDNRIRTDLNCDGEDEIILSGIKLTRIEKKNEDSEVGNSAEKNENSGNKNKGQNAIYGAETIVAITQTPTTGRPQSETLHFPVIQEPGEPGYLCRERVTVTASFLPTPDITPAANEKSNTPQESTHTNETQEQSCPARLEISDRACTPVIIRWNGKNYEAIIEGKPQI